MNTSSTLRTLPKVLALLVALGCTLPQVHAKVGEQENWYLAKEISTEITGYTPNSWDQYYSFDVHTSQTTGEEVITVIFQGISGETDIPVTIKTFSLEGEMLSSNTLLTELPENRAYDIEVDTDGKIYGVNYSYIFCVEDDEVLWKKDYNNENPSFRSLTIGPDEKIYAASDDKKKIYVFDKLGNKLSEIGGPGEAPGQFANSLFGVDFLPNGNLITSTYNRLHVFKTDGTFIKRTDEVGWDSTQVTVSATGQILAWGKLFDQDLNALKSAQNDGGYYLNFARSYPNNFAKWTSSGDIVTTAWKNNQRPLQIWKRAYRTKGLPTPNMIPQPIVRSVAQRPGTNILDIDFEIIDGDDATATAGLIAAVDGNFNDLSELIIPTAFDEGTENKIGQPIATNQAHRVSWYVKGDWNELSGNLKVGVICRDARRTKPVDLHFLELPLVEGTLTISRSPIKDNDMINYFQFLLATQTEGIILESGKIKKADGTTLVDYDINQTPNQRVTQAGRDFFMDTLGYRWASIAELSAAREAATPGTVNQWTATNQIIPRGLPGQVNEYGFDVGNHGTRAWWVVKESSISIPEFSSVAFDQDGSENDQFGNRLLISGNKLVIGQSNNNDYSLQFFETDANGQAITPLGVIKPTESDNLSSLYAGFGNNELTLEGNLLAVGTPNAYAADPNNQKQVNWDSWDTGAVYLFNLDGNSPTQVQRLQASDGTQADNFGHSVDIDNNLLVTGAPADDQDGLQSSGSAYVFKKEPNGGYIEIAKLLPEESQADAYFGNTVAVADQIISIGAPNQDITVDGNTRRDVGSVFLFKEDGSGNVSFTQEIQAPNPHNDSYFYFGNSIGLDGSKMIVGANQVSYSTTDSYIARQGAAYLYLIQSDGTAQLAASIFSPNPRDNGQFGYSVAIEGDRLLISALYEDSDNGSQSGVVYVYKVTADGKVSLQERLTHPNGKANDEFGRAIDLAGQNILVGAPGYDLSNERWNGGGAVLFHSSQ